MNLLRHQRLIPVLAILGAVTALAIGTSWAKLSLFPLIGAEGTTALRIGFSALLVGLLWRPWRHPLAWADARTVVFYGAALGGMNLLFYLSLQTLPFGLAVAIEFSGPLAVALVSSRRPLDFVWIVLAVAGLGLLLPLGLGSSDLDPVGVGYALGAAVLWATYIVFGKRLSHLHAGHSVSLGLMVAAFVAMPVGVASAGTALLSPTVLLVGLGVALISSAIPISLEMLALKRLPKSTFGVMVSLEPAVAALLAIVLLGELLESTQWLAIGCIVAASIGSAATARPSSPPEQIGPTRRHRSDPREPLPTSASAQTSALTSTTSTTSMSPDPACVSSVRCPPAGRQPST